MKLKTLILIITIIHTLSSCSTTSNPKTLDSSLAVQDENITIETNKETSQTSDKDKISHDSEHKELSDTAYVVSSAIGLIIGIALLVAIGL